MADWQDDYSPETGMTGTCPRCGSHDVEYGDVVMRPRPPWPATQTVAGWSCNACGFRENDLMARPVKAAYGWILVNGYGKIVEPLTRTHRVPFYRSESAAQKAADKFNAARQY